MARQCASEFIVRSRWETGVQSRWETGVRSRWDTGVPRPALLVVNTHSRRGRADIAGVVARILEQSGVPVLHRECEDAGKLPGLIRSTADQVDRVMIGGGDG